MHIFSQVLVSFRHIYFHSSCSLSFVAEEFFSEESYVIVLYQKLAKVSKVRESFFSMHDYFVSFSTKVFRKAYHFGEPIKVTDFSASPIFQKVKTMSKVDDLGQFQNSFSRKLYINLLRFHPMLNQKLYSG